MFQTIADKLVNFKLDRLAPQLCPENKIEKKIVTPDTWNVTHDTWQMAEGQYSLKILALSSYTGLGVMIF